MISRDGGDVLIRVKVVPGASRAGIAGVLGDRLKVRVSAPAEGGRANKAVCAVIAAAPRTYHGVCASSTTGMSPTASPAATSFDQSTAGALIRAPRARLAIL